MALFSAYGSFVRVLGDNSIDWMECVDDCFEVELEVIPYDGANPLWVPGASPMRVRPSVPESSEALPFFLFENSSIVQAHRLPPRHLQHNRRRRQPKSGPIELTQGPLARKLFAMRMCSISTAESCGALRWKSLRPAHLVSLEATRADMPSLSTVEMDPSVQILRGRSQVHRQN